MQNKKVAAALAAVQLYLQQEEAEAAETAGRLLSEPAAAAKNMAAEPGAWAQSGRLDMMAGRRMIQLRAFSNAR